LFVGLSVPVNLFFGILAKVIRDFNEQQLLESIG
jgi:hypothetical protein